MNKETDKFGRDRFEQMGLVAFAEQVLRGADYDIDAINAVEAEAENIKFAFARLLLVLYTNQALTKPEVYKVLGVGEED